MPVQRLPRQPATTVMKAVRHRRLPVGDVSTGGGSCPPTVVWEETFGMDDFLQLIYSLPFPDSFAMAEEGLGVLLSVADTLGIADQLTQQQLLSFQETIGLDDRLSLAQVVTFLQDSIGLDDSFLTALKPMTIDSLGLDDRLSQSTLTVGLVETIGATEGALGVAVRLFETMGLDDRLSFLSLLAIYADSIGLDDRLTLAVVSAIYSDTLGLDDRLSFVDVMSNMLDTEAQTDNLGVKVGLVDTQGTDDSLFVDGFFNWTEGARFRYLYVPGVFWVGHARTADNAVLDITGDIDVRFAVRPNDATPAAFSIVAGKYASAGNQESWFFGYDQSSTGRLILDWTANGSTDLSAISTAAVGTADGELVCIRVTLDVVNGANKTIKFFKKTPTSELTVRADLQSNSGWTQIGADVTTAGNTSIFSSTAPLTVGQEGNNIFPFSGQIWGGVIKSGIDGTTVWDWLASDATSIFGDVTEIANSLTVTVSNDASLSPGVWEYTRYGPVEPGFGDVLTLVRLRDLFMRRVAGVADDSEPSGDSWTDQASAGTNHGGDVSNFAKGKSTLANDERRLVFEADLTLFANLRAFPGGGKSITFTVNNGSLLSSVDVSFLVSTYATRPFTESTVTWNNDPGPGTAVKTQVFTVPANTTGFLCAITFTDAQLDAMLGKWVYIRATTPTAAAPLQAEIRSRESGVATTSPVWALDLRR